MSLIGKSLKNITGEDVVGGVVNDVLSSGVPTLSVDNFIFSTTPNLDNTENRILVLNTGNDEIEYRDVSSLPVVNPFDQDLNVADDVEFNTLKITTPVLDNTENRLLVFNTSDNEVEYRDVSSLPVINPFDQDLNVVDDVEFNTLKITTPSLDNTENRLLVFNTSDNEVEYRDVSSLPVVNPFDQDLNTTDDVEFNTLTAFSAELNRLTGTGNLIVERNIVLNSTELNNAQKLQTQQLFVAGDSQMNGNISSSTGELRFVDTLNMNANNVINVGTLNFDSVNGNNSNVNLLTINGSNDVEFRNVSSLPVVNPFDQDLNTTDNVDFNNISVNSTSTNVLTTNGASFITMPSSLSVVGAGENITITTGNDLILAGRVLDNTANKILVQDGSNITKYKDEDELLTFPLFEQGIFTGTYTTSSTTYTTGPPALNINPLPLGKYMVQYCAEIGNTNRNRESYTRIRFTQTGQPDVILNVGSKPDFDNNSTLVNESYLMWSGFSIIDNVNNVNSSFITEFRAGGNTAILRKPRIFVYKINV